MTKQFPSRRWISPLVLLASGFWLLTPVFLRLCILDPFKLSQESDKKGFVHLYGKLLSEPFC